MAAVKGKVREDRAYAKSVGLFEAGVVAMNPSREELEKLLGIEMDKDPEYLKEDEKDGVQTLRLTVWLKEVVKGQLFPVQFFLKDAPRTNKDGTKNQYLNSVGDTSWADDPTNLPEWFTDNGRTYRVANVGEEEMYKFFRSWLKIDTRDVDAVLDFDWKKLMRGNIKELTDCMNTPYAATLVALATIATSKDGEKEYQQVYNRAFLPGSMMKFFTLGGKKVPKMVTKFIDNVEDLDYGCKQFYGAELLPLHEYNPAENVASGDDTAISEDGPDIN